MQDEHWQEFWDGLIGRWAEGRSEFVDRRRKVWRDRFGEERFVVLKAALEELETRCKRWPSFADMHEAIKIVKARFDVHAPREAAPDTPMTTRERRAQALNLRRAADRRCSKGRGTPDDAWCRMLYALADLYDRNADAHERGEPIAWPPTGEASFGAFGDFGRLAHRPPREGRDRERFRHLPPDEFVEDSREPEAEARP